MEKTHTSIASSLVRIKPGELIFPTDFRGKGTEGAIKKSLSRLAKAGKLTRLAHGIYFIPKKDPLIGVLYPSPEYIANMLAKKERVQIRPAGTYALHKLGLTTQVPTKLVYITNGPSRLIKVGNTTIKFKATSNKKLATKGKISSLLIQVMEEYRKEKMDLKMKTKVRDLLQKEDPKLLKHDLSLAPARVHDDIIELLKEKDNDKLAEVK